MDIKTLVNETNQALNNHDLEKFLSYHDSNIEFTEPGRAGKGHADFIVTLKLLAAAFPDMRVTSENLVVEGDRAFFEGQLDGTQTAPLRMPGGPEIPATGKRVSFRAAVYIQVRNDKIIKSHLYNDRMELMQQLGITPQASAAARG